MKVLVGSLLMLASAASAQSIAPGAAVYPSPALGRHFLDQPVAQCVIATPVSPTAVMLTPCPVGAPLPAPTPPPGVTAPIAPTAEPKQLEPREPIVIRIEVIPVAPATQPAPKPAKKKCPAC